MSGLNILSENLINDATISLSSGTENAQFPLSNLLNESPALKFRSTTNTVTILLDATVTRTVDTVMLVGDATETIGVTAVTVKGSVTTDFSGSTAIPVVINSEYNMGIALPTAGSFRYWQVEVTGTGSFVEIGNIALGERVQLTENNLGINSFQYKHNDKSDVYENEYDQKFVDTKNAVKSITGRIEYCTKTEQDTLDEIYRRHGRHLPLWMIIDENSDGMIDGLFRLSIYGHLLRGPIWKATGGQTYSSTITVKEAI